MSNTSALTKRLDGSWVVGTNQGGLDTGSIADTTYHVYVIKRLDTNVVDVIFSASASAPTLPTNYTIFRRVASFIRVSGAIVAFSQFGDEFLLSAPFLDYDGNQPTTSSLLPMRIPTGIKMQAMLRVRGTNASIAWAILISSPDVPAVAPQTVTAPLADIGNTSGLIDRATLRVRTDTSARVRAQANNSGTDLQISAYGWIDARGKN